MTTDEFDTQTGAHRDIDFDAEREAARTRLRKLNRRRDVLEAFNHERERQLTKWGEQHHPNRTGLANDASLRETYREHCDALAAAGRVGWRDILLEEVYEAFAETDDRALEVELIQAGAVITAWVEDIRARRG